MVNNFYIRDEVDCQNAKAAIANFERRQRAEQKAWNQEEKTSKIVFEVLRCYGKEYVSVNTKNRKREIVQTRQVTYYLLKKYTRKSLGRIGKTYGQDHATVLHGIKNICNLYATDSSVRKDVDYLEKILVSMNVTEAVVSNEDLEKSFRTNVKSQSDTV